MEAATTIREALQRAAGCVTDAVLVAGRGGYTPAPESHVFSLSNSPVRLSGRSHVSLSLDVYFRIIPDGGDRRLWRTELTGYAQQLLRVEGREILAYHWHPAGPSAEIDPHLHLSVGAQVGRLELVTAHLPTGLVMIQDVLKLVVQTFGVRPRRPDWVQVLAQTRAAIDADWQRTA